MKTKVIQFFPTLFILAVIGFRYFSQWCIISSSSCQGTWVHQIYIGFTSPLYFFSLYSLPAALIVACVPRHIFISWLKLIAGVLPLALIFIAITPVNFMGIGLDLFPFYRDDAARLMGGMVTALSLSLVGVKYFIMRRTPRKG